MAKTISPAPGPSGAPPGKNVRDRKHKWTQTPDGSWVLEPKRHHVFRWIVGTAAALLILIIVLVGVVINGAVDQLNAEQQAHAITPAQYTTVKLGVTRQQLESQLGKQPENAQEFVSKGFLNQGQLNSSCLYYNESGKTFGHLYQFCFTNDQLDTKSAY